MFEKFISGFLTAAVFVLINLNRKHLAAGQLLSLGSCPNLQAMKNFDINKYYGRWYLLERYFFVYFAPASCVSINYYDNGSNETFGTDISMLFLGRSQINVNTRNEINKKDGTADFTLDVPLFNDRTPILLRYPYLVLHTDYDNYIIKWACRNLGVINSQMMLVLGRKNKPFSEKVKRRIYAIIKSLGLRSDVLLSSNLSKCNRDYVQQY